MLGGLYSSEFSSIWGVLLFAITVAVAFLSGLYVIFRFINSISSYVGKKSVSLKILNKILNFGYYIIFGILVLIVLQMLSYSQYSVDLFITFAIICFSSAAIIFIQNAFKFFSWYRSNKNLIILLYASTFRWYLLA